MKKRSGELISAGCEGTRRNLELRHKAKRTHTEHLLELSGLYQVPMHSREAAMKDWPLRQATLSDAAFAAIRDSPRPAKSAAEQSRRHRRRLVVLFRMIGDLQPM